MDFDLSEEQRLLKESVDGLLNSSYDFDARKKYAAEKGGWSKSAWSKLAEQGLLGLPFSEDDGGFGAGPIEISKIHGYQGDVGGQEMGRELLRREPSRLEEMGIEAGKEPLRCLAIGRVAGAGFAADEHQAGIGVLLQYEVDGVEQYVEAFARVA